MARELSRPLTEEDIVFLRGRYPAATVDRYVELYGAPEGDDEPSEPGQDHEDGDESSEEGSGDPESTDDADGAESGQEDDDEDLIGDAPEGENLGDVAAELYDPLAHTTTEVRSYMKTASVDEVNRVKVIERERTDREPRTSITEYNPS